MLLIPLAGCGAPVACAGGGCTPPPENLNVQPQNTTLLVGVNRISIALLDTRQNPVSATGVSVDIITPAGKSLAHRPLQNIAAVYGGIPVYVGIAQFPTAGQYEFLVTGNGASAQINGHAYVTVAASGPEVAIGARVPALHQAVLTDPGVTISMVDSGVPPDTWHDQTVAQALAAHKPMVLFFGEPGFCPSKTCGPTVAILKQLCAQYCGQFSFQHIEDSIPASNAQVPNNPAFRAFGLQTEPWVFFVNGDGVVTDRFEGPTTLDDLKGAASGTLAGHVPAVSLSA
ncbi:MAG: hypothetical protein JF887_10055 [Candidatus Dormibacteraeota bacterium]|uniref:Thioredoxin domain-containing protein n=1 Tax=Candidatus Amunia macphersoniae TaxID=3127014 RepID=A0A934KRC0_9BACT|nr:hypothetical protein [Candidatus Dormibacteraeota bacterium]